MKGAGREPRRGSLEARVERFEDRVAHFLGRDGGAAFGAHQIGGAGAVGQCLFDGFFQTGRFFA